MILPLKKSFIVCSGRLIARGGEVSPIFWASAYLNFTGRASARKWVIPLCSPNVTTSDCEPSQFDFAPPCAFLPIRVPLQAEVRAEELFLLDS